MMLPDFHSENAPIGLPLLSPDLVARAQAGDVGLETTQSFHDITVLSQMNEPKARELHDRHEQEVRLAWRGVSLSAHQQAVLLVAANATAIKENAPIHVAITAAKNLRDKSVQRHTERLRVLEERDLPFCHALAADLVAQAKRKYDYLNPSDETVTKVNPPSLKMIAINAGLPYPPQDRWAQLLYKYARVLCVIEAGVGFLAGLGLNAWTNHLHGRGLEHLSPVLCCYLLGGLALVTVCNLGICWLASRTVYHYYRRLPVEKWAVWWVATALACGLFVAADCWLQTHGLQSMAQTAQHVTSIRGQSQSGTSGSAWWIGLCLSTFVAILAVSHGHGDGRYDAIMPQLEAHQEMEQRRLEAYRLVLPIVQEALRALAMVRTLIHQALQEKKAIEEANLLCDEQCAQLAANLLPIRDANDPEVNQPIKDAFEKACVVQEVWRRDFGTLLGKHMQWEPETKL